MRIEDLNIFNEMPFLFWVKDAEGKHLFGNKVICDLAGFPVQGHTSDRPCLAFEGQVTTTTRTDKRIRYKKQIVGRRRTLSCRSSIAVIHQA